MAEHDETEDWQLGQCVYEMSTGKRCPKEARMVVLMGPAWLDDAKKKAWGYCHDHYFSITRPRDPRIHRTAEPLIRADAAAESEAS
jgi:hypothetical protein